MNHKASVKQRIKFRDWLRNELRTANPGGKGNFYQSRGDHYLIREFAKFCVQRHRPVDEASLGRYLREVNPVLPTPARCRALARVLGYPPIKVLIVAGYLHEHDDQVVEPDQIDDTDDTAVELSFDTSLEAIAVGLN